MDAIFIFLGTVAVAIISSLTTYLISRRTSSGEIRTTEAATLWAESQAIRKEQREELTQLKAELQAERELREATSTELQDVRERLIQVEENHAQCREDLTILTAELHRLTGETK